jgi:hypothetical protein
MARRLLLKAVLLLLPGVLLFLGLEHIHVSLSRFDGNHVADNWFCVSLVYGLVGLFQFQGWNSSYRGFFTLYLDRSERRLRDFKDREDRFDAAFFRGVVLILGGILFFVISLSVG